MFYMLNVIFYYKSFHIIYILNILYILYRFKVLYLFFFSNSMNPLYYQIIISINAIYYIYYYQIMNKKINDFHKDFLFK